ncbi:RNA 2',3'-cyclic phosphodiesterase [Streptomyces sp. NPDC047999]|uniref:RNA 2',3'-cyclic phosphodiesterase n=1 Tax=Streptomyces sp. NPDC047999 TaxID=3365497 RepID=UPI00371D6354
MRLFAAVLPPPRAAEELAEALGGLRDLPGATGLRWTGRAGWHFTLAFMGEVDDGLLPELRERLGRAAHRTPAFPLRLRGGGHFGRRALWVGADGEAATMRLLAERSLAAARRTGITVDAHRPYTPHLTVARAREDTDLRPYAEALRSFESLSWQVDRLCLVRSNLPVRGVRGEQPRYETVESWPLPDPG